MRSVVMRSVKTLFYLLAKVPYFFSRENFMPHSLTRFRAKLYFFSENCFFFRPEFFDFGNFIFFYQENFRIHSLSQINQPEKKYSTGKKNPSFSLTHSIFPRKWQKLNFSREIKNYGTFVTCYDNKLNRVIFKLSY